MVSGKNVKITLALVSLIIMGCTDAVVPDNAVIACIGDSITFADKNGYPEFLQHYVDSNLPDKNVSFLNWGKNSETITNLTEDGHPGPRPYLFDRLDSLLERSPKPNIVTFCYGINCGIYGKPSKLLFNMYKNGVVTYSWKQPYENYEKEVLEEFRKIVLNLEHPAIIKKIDIHNPLLKNIDSAYGWDPIHPNEKGNQIIGEVFIKEIF